MVELPFHGELYDGFAIDEAVKVYAPFASMELEKKPHGFLVRLTLNDGMADDEIDERTIAAELMNYALGKTIERRGAAGLPGSDEVAS